MSKKSELPEGVGRIELDATRFDKEPDNEHLPLLATRSLVLFPGVTVPVSLGRESSVQAAMYSDENAATIGLVCQKDPETEKPAVPEGLYRWGVYVDVLTMLEMPDGTRTAFVRSRGCFMLEGPSTRSRKYPKMLRGRVTPLEDVSPEPSEVFTIMVENIRELAKSLFESVSDNPALLPNMSQIRQEEELVNYVSSNLNIPTAEKIDLLAIRSIEKRAVALLEILQRESRRQAIAKEIIERTQVNMGEGQRNAFLQQQMETIREELYGSAEDDPEQFDARLKKLKVDAATRRRLTKEIDKLRRLNPSSPDYSVQYTYLDTVLGLPWNKYTAKTPTDLMSPREILDSDHFGMEKVKSRVLEQLALLLHTRGRQAPILCLVGPPGVGKTSIGRSVARALGRAYERVSLGGLHDEAEIRGHRRTYIGAMPGRVIEAVRRAGASDPVLILDEIDKLGADYKGDPSSALLEVLDPEQNCHFHDNYVDLDFDLSKILFIATANSLAGVPGPLLDRMEIIELSGYLLQEKMNIARRHILPRLMKEYEISADQLSISDRALENLIGQYTAESGVRQLEKKLAALLRKYLYSRMDPGATPFPNPVEAEDLYSLLGLPLRAPQDGPQENPPGVVTGLAWTEIGGEILMAETLTSPGKGALTMTGNLGNVMKESATIALQWIRGNASALGINAKDLTEKDFHVHFPEGAVPKDGPSAGITIVTSIVSALKGIPVSPTLAMTGEITLRGTILPVGGIKEKILAAKRFGSTDIALSERNRRDIEDIPAEYTEGLRFHYFDTVSALMDHVF